MRRIPQDRSARLRLAALLALLLVRAVAPGTVSAQAPAVPAFATPAAPAGHWSLAAARRIDALGLAPAGFDRGLGTRTLRELAALFESAAAEAELRALAVAPLLHAYRLRFAEEFGPISDAVLAGAPSGRIRSLDATVTAGYARTEGAALAGFGYDNGGDWTGPVAVGTEASSITGFQYDVALPPFLAGRIAALRRDDAWSYDDAHAVLLWRSAGAWIGRRSVGFGPGLGGGTALGRSTTFDGGGLFLDGPVSLPGGLGRLGALRLETFFSRLEHEGPIRKPWFWSSRLSVAPHRRLGLGITRAVLFGGEGNSAASLRTLAYLLVGKHAGEAGEYDNQVLAVDFSYRPPLGPLPLALYMEWGLDDSAGAWKDVPGVVAGVEIPAVPGLPELALGLERTAFAGSCCGNTIWYRNWAFRAGWTDEGRPLGHPLGGHGTEWLASARLDLRQARARVDLRGFLRDRGAENLFAPDRQGRSRGGSIRLEVRPGDAMEFFFDGSLEDGARDWRASTLLAGARLLF